MKVLITAALFAVSAFTGQAGAADFSYCGAYSRAHINGPYRSDPGGGNQVSVYPYRSDFRAIVVRSSKSNTRIQYMDAFDHNSRRWIPLVTSRVFLGEDNELLTCIPRRWDIGEVRVWTSGGDNAKFRVLLYYSK